MTGNSHVRTWAWVALAAQLLLVVSWVVAGFWQGPRYAWRIAGSVPRSAIG
jgi:hypothetical protein